MSVTISNGDNFQSTTVFGKAFIPFLPSGERWHLENIFSELNKDADTENLRIDSTCVKVLESSNGGENKVIRRTKGDLNTKILAYIKEQRATVVIPPKSNAKEPWAVDYCLYKERHLVECSFQKIKWFRIVST